MHEQEASGAHYRWAAVIAVPLLVLLTLTFVHVGYGINLVDEGYLWYGAQRTAAGEFPLVSFQAYEPGRYLWVAWWMRMTGDDGILVLRWSGVAFEALAIAAVSLVAFQQTRSAVVSILAGVVCVLFLCPWHGRFEPSIAVLEAAVLAGWIERPSPRRYLLVGVFLGAASIFNVYLGAYGLFGFLVALALIARSDRASVSAGRVLLTGAGLLIGYLPLVAIMFRVPGLAGRIAAEYGAHLSSGSVKGHLPLSIPWPWKLPYNSPFWVDNASQFFYGSFFVLAIFFGPIVLALVFLKKRDWLREHPLFTVSAALSISYAHYILSRPDMEHLLRGGAPLVLAMALLPVSRNVVLRSLPGFATIAVLWVMLHVHWAGCDSRSRTVIVGREPLCVQADAAMVIEASRALVAQYVRAGEAVFIAPYHVGLYPALGLKAPTWEIFAFGPRSAEFQREEIERLEAARTRLVIFFQPPIDPVPELFYTATHPVIAEYLRTNFAVLPQKLLPPEYLVLIRP